MEIRLNKNVGTYKTDDKVIVGEMTTIPTPLTVARDSLATVIWIKLDKCCRLQNILGIMVI